MGFLDRLFGADTQAARPSAQSAPDTRRRAVRAVTRSADERAVARYRYLLQTAPPETIEQVHAEAFAKLSDDQRAVIYEELSKGAGTGERPLSSEPATLARSATRAESRRPGTLERGLGAGADVGGPLLGTVAGYVVGSALVSAFLPWDANSADTASVATDGSGSEMRGSEMRGSDMRGSDVSGFGGGFDGDFDGDFF